jgi:phospholipid/cholesterol/gamma-HCH transport system substrate-binding protein
MRLFGRGERARVARKDRRGMAPFLAGLLLIGITVMAVFFGFTKKIPFTHGFRVEAVFQNASNIRPASPVRIAGVNVGKVTKVERYRDSDTSLVTMELNDEALPIHRDATMKIRPRIFLEGNFFVDLKPGTPSSPTIDDGDTIGVTQTASPVQLDEVLTSLQSDARQDLRDVLEGYGTALTYQPTAADDAGQDPDVRGRTGAQALNRTYEYAPGALRGVSVVNEALLGTERGDLSKLIASFGRVARALASDEQALQGLITNFNTTTGAFAAEQTNLQAPIRLLGPTLRATNRALDSLNAAFPATRAFAREILPGVRQTPGTINASFPWIAQMRGLLGPNELRGLARELRRTSASVASLTDSTITLLPQVDLVNRCVTNVILPTGDVVIQDGGAANPNLHSGVENYKEFFYTLVALSGEGQNFDGNGMYVRFQPGGGPFTVSTGQSSLSGQQLFGNAAARPLGTRPRFPGRRSPYVNNRPCHTQPRPDLNGPAAEIGPAEQVRGRSAPLSQDPRLQAVVPSVQPRGETSRPDPAGQVTQEIISRLNPFGRHQPGSGQGTAGAGGSGQGGQRP